MNFKTLTQEELRGKLPGYENQDILCLEKRSNGHNKMLTLKYRIVGHCKDVLFVHNFWVDTWDAIGPTCKTFNHLQEAVEFYASLT